MPRLLTPFRLLLALGLATRVLAQGPITTAFNYQGQLRSGGAPVTGTYDFRFRLYDSPTGGLQLGPMICADNVSVTSGGFTLPLDFGAQFNGLQRHLEIDVRQDTGLNCSNAAGFTLLTPRQQLTAEPYALWAKTASALGAPDGSPATAVSVDNSGNVGIGTATPTAPLQITMPPSGAAAVRIQGLSSGVANTAFLSFSNSVGTDIGYVGDGSSGDNSVFLGAYIGDVALSTQGGRVVTAGADGSFRLGTGSGDYRRFIVGGGNSDGFLYGSYPAFGDGIHMGYNFYANAAGSPVVVHPDGGTSRITTSYGSISLATAPAFGGPPVNRVDVDQNGTLHVLNGNGTLDVASYYPDPPPDSISWPQGTYPLGTPFYSAGAIALYAPAGNVRWGVRSRYNPGFSVFPDQGEMFMDDATGTNRISINVEGESGASLGVVSCTHLYATQYKNFVTPNPDNPAQDITYCCIEGPEAAMYTRGTAHLIAGSAHIDLPDTFASIASKDGLTIILTPLSAESRGLACVNRSIHGFDVAELLHGDGTYDFDWEIKAVRRGCRDYQVVHPWTELAHGNKPLDVLWQQRMNDVQVRDAKFAKEDQEIGPRPER